MQLYKIKVQTGEIINTIGVLNDNHTVPLDLTYTSVVELEENLNDKPGVVIWFKKDSLAYRTALTEANKQLDSHTQASLTIQRLPPQNFPIGGSE